MTMAHRIVVMKDGHILQVGTPSELYEAPVDVFTARFIGSPSMNLLLGTRTTNSIAPSAASCNAGRKRARFTFSTPKRKSFWAAHDDNRKISRH